MSLFKKEKKEEKKEQQGEKKLSIIKGNEAEVQIRLLEMLNNNIVVLANLTRQSVALLNEIRKNGENK